ncbi:MAG: phosphatase PAP2 family protein [Bacteroidales bacterium]|nr:phosphatase PAP2 family protein [Bacteroidales bacterium]
MKFNNYYIRRNLLKIILTCLFVPCLFYTTKCQQDTAYKKVSLNKKYIASYWHDTKKIVTEPARWKGKQWGTLAALVGVWTITYVYDEEIYKFFQDNRTQTKDDISKYLIESWGSGLYSIPLLGIIYLTGRKNNHHRNVALTGLKAFLLSGGAAVITKHLFHRHRPTDNDPPNPYLWEGPFPFTADYTSFPSGHTTTAFAVASVLAHGYKDKIWIGITSYSIAALVGISRLNDNKHWATDVLAGAVLGAFIGTTLSKINFDGNKNIKISPTAFQGGYGMRVVYQLN